MDTVKVSSVRYKPYCVNPTQTSFHETRERWFVLTRSDLSYFDGADTAKRKEKGRVALKDVRVVEPVSLRDEAKPNSFQIGYR